MQSRAQVHCRLQNAHKLAQVLYVEELMVNGLSVGALHLAETTLVITISDERLCRSSIGAHVWPLRRM